MATTMRAGAPCLASSRAGGGHTKASCGIFRATASMPRRSPHSVTTRTTGIRGDHALKGSRGSARGFSDGKGIIASPRGPSSQEPRVAEHARRPLAAAAEELTGDSSVKPTAGGVLAFLGAFYKFTRPHTMIGTALGVVSVSMLAVRGSGDLTAALAVGMGQALSSALLMNVAIVGLNQCYDVEIDKVNKPYLPLASGEFSMSTAWALVLGSCAGALAIGAAAASPPLMLTLVVSALLGLAYSCDLPFLRWKRSPALAAMCILVIRAIFVQLGFFFHIRSTVFGAAIVGTPSLVFALTFMCLFSVAIALSKDIPDVEGDRASNIRTLSVRMGQGAVFKMVLGLLYSAYGCGVIAGLASGAWWSKLVMVAGHVAMATLLHRRSASVDLASPDSIYSWYMYVWKLFYLEYLILPFALR